MKPRPYQVISKEPVLLFPNCPIALQPGEIFTDKELETKGLRHVNILIVNAMWQEKVVEYNAPAAAQNFWKKLNNFLGIK